MQETNTEPDHKITVSDQLIIPGILDKELSSLGIKIPLMEVTTSATNQVLSHVSSRTAFYGIIWCDRSAS